MSIYQLVDCITWDGYVKQNKNLTWDDFSNGVTWTGAIFVKEVEANLVAIIGDTISYRPLKNALYERYFAAAPM